MSFGGSVGAMVTSLKNNRNLLRKKKYSDLAETMERHKYSNYIPINNKEISFQKLSQIKEEIKYQKYAERRRNIFISVLLFCFIAGGTFITVKAVEKSTLEKMNEKKEIIQPSQSSKLEKAREQMELGKKAIQTQKYTEAKIHLAEAFNIYDTYEVNFALTNAYVLDCIANNVDCEIADQMVKSSLKKYGDLSALKKLESLLLEKQ